MKTYQCHKKVQAAKIIGISVDGTLYFEDDESTQDVGLEWISKHNPQLDGYYVVYDDGYTSYSPAEAFEAGYSEI